MANSPFSAIHRGAAQQPMILPDRRRHKRFAVTLLGRFMRANKQEYPCKMIDISVGGLALSSPVEVEPGERIVAYIDQIGGLEGHVVRIFEGGFAMQLLATQHKREKLAAAITWLVNRDELGTHEARRHERMPASKTTTLKLADDTVHSVRLIDVSISGASVAIDSRPPLGSDVMLGRLRARIVRHHGEGIAVQFLNIQNPEAVRRHFG